MLITDLPKPTACPGCRTVLEVRIHRKPNEAAVGLCEHCGAAIVEYAGGVRSANEGDIADLSIEDKWSIDYWSRRYKMRAAGLLA